MDHTITIHIDDENFKRFQRHAEMEELTLEKFVETAAIRYVEQNELINEFELARLLDEENLLD
jgi:hypothetical protein